MRAMLGLLLFCHTAFGSGLDVPQIGSPFSGPAATDAASAYFNPAGLAGLQRTQFLLDVGAVAGRVAFTRERLGQYQYSDSLEFQDPIDPAYVDPTKTGPSETESAIPASPYVNAFIGLPIRDKWAVGGGVYIPYAAPLRFDYEGDQRYALQQAFIAVVHATAAVAYAPSDRVRLGAGVTYVSGLGSLRKVQDFAGLDVFADGFENPPINQPNSFGEDAPSTVRELDVLSRPFSLTNSLTHGVDANLGIQIVPTDDLVVGLTYHHGSRARFRGDIAIDFDDGFFTQDLASQGIEFVPLVEGTGTLSFRLPARILLGARWAVNDRLILDTEVHYVLWHTLRAFEIVANSPDLEQPTLGIGQTIDSSIPRSWRDTIHVELNPQIRVKDTSLLGLTAGYHSSASPDATVDVSSPDGHRLVAGAAFAFLAGENLRLMTDVNVQAIVPRTVTTSDYDLANGTYNLILGAVGFHAQWGF